MKADAFVHFIKEVILMSFPETLRLARRRAGLTQLQVAQALGVTTSTYCGYETGQRQPDIPKLRRLCILLGLSGDELLGVPSVRPRITREEQAVLDRFRALDVHGRRLVDLVLDEELRRISAPPVQTVPFRISEQSAAAGLGTYLGPDVFRTAFVRADALPHGAAFGVPVSGDSMEPRYHDGDVLIIASEPPEPGEVGLFIMDGAGYVKVLGDGALLSLNPAYAPIPITESMHACGRVMGTLSSADCL